MDTPSASNRPLAFPYNKWHSTQWTVNQAAALMLCSVEVATRCGVPTDRWVFPLAGRRVEPRRLACSAGAIPMPGRPWGCWARPRPTGSGARWPRRRSWRPTAAFRPPSGSSSASWGWTGRRLRRSPEGWPLPGGPFNNFVLQSMVEVIGRLRAEPGCAGGGHHGQRSPDQAGHRGLVGPARRPAPAGGRSGRRGRSGTGMVDVVETLEGYQGEATVVTYTVTFDGMEPVRTVALCETADGRPVRGGQRGRRPGRPRHRANELIGTRARVAGGRSTWPERRADAAPVRCADGHSLDEAFAFVAQHRQGVLVTMRERRAPQLSNILYLAASEHSVRISVTDTRAKTRNLRRDPRASLHVTRDDFFAYVVLEGEGALSPVAAAPDDPVVEELVAMYRLASGEHPDWERVPRGHGVPGSPGGHLVGHPRLRDARHLSGRHRLRPGRHRRHRPVLRPRPPSRPAWWPGATPTRPAPVPRAGRRPAGPRRPRRPRR